MSFVRVCVTWEGDKHPQKFVFDSMATAKDAIVGMLKKFERHELVGNAVKTLDTVKGDTVVEISDKAFKIEVGLTDTATIEPDAGMLPDDMVIAYVLMRQDVPDYLSGKAQAQSNHAGTHMVFKSIKKNDPALNALMNEWADEADGFGTCIVLSVTAPEMRQAVSLANLLGLHAGIVHDPTYPIRDGDRYNTLPIDTCAYVFGRKSECAPVVGKFPLLRDRNER